MAVFFASLMMALTMMAVEVLGQNRDTVVFNDQQSCTTIGEIGGRPVSQLSLHNEA